jgi:hypothetical protein
MHGIILVRMCGSDISGAAAARLRSVVDRHMAPCADLRSHCDRCLATQRWGGSVTLMLVDAAFMSIGLNYFTAVVPAVSRYGDWMNHGRVPTSLDGLSKVSYCDVSTLWKNRRSWEMVREVAAVLADGSTSDAISLRSWAADAPLATWSRDPVGAVKGVGINTYQYLRMMGGVDTSMPDKIVRRVIADIVADSGIELPIAEDLDLIDTISRIAVATGYRPIELCWMTWMVQSEGKTMRMAKYRGLLHRI